MSEQATTSRSLHDLGLAAWFGGSLMGAIGLNGATKELDDSAQAARAANAGWAKWEPANFAAIAAHLIGSVAQLQSNKGRVLTQSGVGSMSVVKTALTVAALAVTGYSGLLGRKLRKLEDEQGSLSAEDATTPAASTPDEAAAAQRKLSVVQWLIPAVTGALVVVSAKVGEQQRPSAVARGFFRR